MDIFEVALGLPKSNHQTACARGEETRPGFVWFIFSWSSQHQTNLTLEKLLIPTEATD